MKNLKKEFNECTKLMIFEIEVLDNNNEIDYIIFDLSIQKNTLVAQHIPLTKKEEKSKKIAFKKLALDNCFSLNEHLQELYEICENSIVESEFFELSNN